LKRLHSKGTGSRGGFTGEGRSRAFAPKGIHDVVVTLDLANPTD